MRARWAKRGLVIAAIAVAAAAIFGFITMSLWNWVAPEVFGLHTITFWQAIGLVLLSKILFGGFHGGRSCHGGHWKRRMSERWQQMTPEEREKFRQGIFSRCGRAHVVAEDVRAAE